ncbi:hypothetical protein [Bdellovibrio sp. NC01]|uniref:hypothetical protein n=1 Tax=Bdellovibrio sp. NC01 TaxID=2220073 RepID=UPI00115B2FBA|nr:hypothetical protein [Bdellovibrio sp. NC01]QDK38443.1 hypothetical protein DOE51_13080 [Bdellovibrio sp. NC01]
MKDLFLGLKDSIVNLYKKIKAMDDMIFNGLDSEFYEEKKEHVRAKRTNNVRIEDLRPPKRED